MTINDYRFDELSGRVSDTETSTLTREDSGADWVLEGLDEQTEEVDKDAMRETVNAIADLEIVGVRPKQKGLTPDLKLDRAALRSQQDVDRLQSDLLTSGFLLQQGDDLESLSLISREGEIYAAANDGLVYRLHFGRVFTGSQDELETGLSSNANGDSTDQTSGSETDKPAQEKETEG